MSIGPPRARRAFARIQILVARTADEASIALAEGDKLIAALEQHLQGRSDLPVQRTKQAQGG
jgi:hypothetical protein